MSVVTLAITDGPTFEDLTWFSGMTGRQVLEAAYNSMPAPVTSFAYNLEYYGEQDDLGYLVSMMNGTFDSFNAAQSPYYFWEFIVNGIVQDYGIDNTVIPANATVTFSFVPYVPAAKASKALQAKYKRRLAYAQ